MKVIIEKKVSEQVEVELPAFRKYGTIHYKVVDEKTAYSVNGKGLTSVLPSSALEETEECTEAEFEAALQVFLNNYGLRKAKH